MADVEIPEQVAAAQRAADQAWAGVEEYRQQVNQRRAEETPDEPGRPAHVVRPRRPWTDAEEAWYAELHAASVARRDAMVAAGIVSTYDAEAAMRAAARA